MANWKIAGSDQITTNLAQGSNEVDVMLVNEGNRLVMYLEDFGRITVGLWSNGKIAVNTVNLGDDGAEIPYAAQELVRVWR